MTTFLKPCRSAGQSAWAKLSMAMALLTAGQAWAGCNVSSSGLSFGPYQPLTFPGHFTSVDAVSTGTVSITCSNMVALASYTLALGASADGAGDRISTRYLANSSGGPNMAFNIYTDATRSVVWGNGSTGAVISGSLPLITLGSQTQNVTVYGKIPAGQNTLKAGTYSGPLTITLTYNP